MPTKNPTYRSRVAERLPGRKHTERKYDERRGNAADRGYDSTWQKVAKAYLRDNPLCASCLKHGEIKEAEVVHHVTPLSEGGKRLDRRNLMSLCRDCHERVHGRKR